MELNITGTAWKGTVTLGVDDATVLDLKCAIAAAAGVPTSEQRLLARGRKLDDASTLVSYGIMHGQQVMLQRMPGVGAASPTGSSATAASPPVSPVIVAPPDAAAERRAWREREIARMEAAAARLAKRDGSKYDEGRHVTPQLTDQHGRAVHLPASDAAALTEGLLLYARARAVVTRVEARDARRNTLGGDAPGAASTGGPAPSATASAERRATRLSFALSLLLKADAAFARADTRYVEMLDNPPQLYLDVVWTYFLLGDIAHLDDAAAYLRRCRRGFERAHGVNLERLHRLKGPDAVEGVLYVRLRLLEGVVSLLGGDGGTAERHLRQARAECDMLMPQEADLHDVIVSAAQCGVEASRGDAVRALRATRDRAPRGDVYSSGDAAAAVAAYEVAHRERINASVLWLLDYREALETRRLEAAARRTAEARAHHAGATSSGAYVNMAHVDMIQSMLGPATADTLIFEALRQTDNDIDESIGILLDEGRRDALMVAVAARAHKRARPEETSASAEGVAAGVDDTGNESATDADTTTAGVDDVVDGDEEEGEHEEDEEGEEEDEEDETSDDDAILELVGAVSNDDDGDGVEAALATYDLAAESAAITRYLESLH